MLRVSWKLAWWKPNFTQDLPHLFSDFGDILYDGSEYNAFWHSLVQWKGAQERPYFYYECKWITFTCVPSSFTALLTWVWEHCIIIIAAALSIGSMGRIPLTFQKHITFTVSSLQERLFWEYCGSWPRILNC